MVEVPAPDRWKRGARGVLRRVRDRLALHGYVSLVHGPLRELADGVEVLTGEVAAVRDDLARAERSRLALQDQLSVGATRGELVLEEVRALRQSTPGARRLVEEPFVHTACAALPAGSRVVVAAPEADVLGQSLAALGHVVTLVSGTVPTVGHPHLAVTDRALTEIEPEAPVDAVVVLSDHQGPDPADVSWASTHLAPRGVVVLSAPFDSSLRDLLEPFEVDRAVLANRGADGTWTVTDHLDGPSAAGELVLLSARRRP